jgi:hypothetical protein
MASTAGSKMVLLPIGGETAERIMKGNPGVFHKTVFQKGIYNGVDRDIDAIAITAVLQAMDTFPADRLYQILTRSSTTRPSWRGVEGGQCPDAAEGRRTGDPGCAEIPPSRGAEVLQGEGRAEIRPRAGLR